MLRMFQARPGREGFGPRPQMYFWKGKGALKGGKQVIVGIDSSNGWWSSGREEYGGFVSTVAILKGRAGQ